VPDSGRDPGFWGTLPGLITALATLLTAIVGAFVLLRPDDPDPPSTATAGVEGAPSTTSTASSPTPLPTWENGEGQFVMTPGMFADLDTGTFGTGPSEDAELYWDPEEGALKTLSASSALIEGHPTANFIITCQGMLEDVRGGVLPVVGLEPGDPMCARTDRGAIASLAVDGVDLGAGTPEIRVSAFVR